MQDLYRLVRITNKNKLILFIMSQYRTLCFKTKKIAQKNELEIKQYFKNFLISSEINEGTDERGKNGFFVQYILKD